MSAYYSKPHRFKNFTAAQWRDTNSGNRKIFT